MKYLSTDLILIVQKVFQQREKRIKSADRFTESASKRNKLKDDRTVRN